MKNFPQFARRMLSATIVLASVAGSFCIGYYAGCCATAAEYEAVLLELSNNAVP